MPENSNQETEKKAHSLEHDQCCDSPGQEFEATQQDKGQASTWETRQPQRERVLEEARQASHVRGWAPGRCWEVGLWQGS